MKYAILVLALVVSGCCNHSGSTVQTAPDKGAVIQGSEDLKIYQDEERGVTCYKIYGYTGISCVKTRASAKEEMENKMIQEIFKGE